MRQKYRPDHMHQKDDGIIIYYNSIILTLHNNLHSMYKIIACRNFKECFYDYIISIFNQEQICLTKMGPEGEHLFRIIPPGHHEKGWGKHVRLLI